MKIINKIQELQAVSMNAKNQGQVISIVPTMGYLHEGHISLVRHAKEMSDIVITSIFVNPTQFAPNEDFESYPRNQMRDEEMLEDSGCDILFAPAIDEIYPLGYTTKITVETISSAFEGKARPTHFSGVATVVAKLFNASIPNLAFFGQKDYQQTLVIKRMALDLNFPVKVIVMPTIREHDGLAMSSRNVYLSQDLRSKAGIIFKALETARTEIEKGERDRKIINAQMIKTLRSLPDIRIDYASAVDAEDLSEPTIFVSSQKIVLLIAVYLGKTRLIDNMIIQVP